MVVEPVDIGGRKIGHGQPCFIIAEAGVNHNGDMETAHQLIEHAVKAGVDAVKFQSYITEEIVTVKAPKAGYQVETTGGKESQVEMLKKLELSWEQQAELHRHCEDAGIMFLCTPYEEKSAGFLVDLGVKAFKIASTDLTNTPFLCHIAERGMPVILSTGMSYLGEIEEAVCALQDNGLFGNIALLHCTSEYPAPIKDANLRVIQTLEKAFKCPVGFSDHTKGIVAAPWAVAVGAAIIEKHFTLNRNMVGPDHRSSLQPDELAALVQAVKDIESALGDGIKKPSSKEIENKAKMQKSLVSKRKILVGQDISREDLACKRPANGLSPSWMNKIIGKKALRDIDSDCPIKMGDILWDNEG